MQNLFDMEQLEVATKIKSSIAKKRQDDLRWNGWGFKDTILVVLFDGTIKLIDSKNQTLKFKGKLPQFFHSFIRNQTPSYIQNLSAINFKPPNLNEDFLQEMCKIGIEISIDEEDRFMRSRRQSVTEVFNIRSGKFSKNVDFVIFPKTHDEVTKIVSNAQDYSVNLIPFSGGEVRGLSYHEIDNRSVAVIDTSQMNRMLWIDKISSTACFESGIIIDDLERVLNEVGFTLGFERGECEFFSLGDCITTRSSSCKQKKYGRIDEIVKKIKVVTCSGVLERNSVTNLNEIIFGSGGMFGVITEVTLKIHRLPKVKQFGSLAFTNFNCGLKFIHELSQKNCKIANVQLFDEEMSQFIEKEMKRSQSVIVCYLLEGDLEDVRREEKIINTCARYYRTVNFGSDVGHAGFVFTSVSGYIRDFALDCGLIFDSSDVSVSWTNCEQLCKNVKATMKLECRRRGLPDFYIAYRVSQIRSDGVCLALYFGFRHLNVIENPVDVFNTILRTASDEICASGGLMKNYSFLRHPWIDNFFSTVEIELLKTLKNELDPKSIFPLNYLVAMPSDKNDLLSKL